MIKESNNQETAAKIAIYILEGYVNELRSSAKDAVNRGFPPHISSVLAKACLDAAELLENRKYSLK